MAPSFGLDYTGEESTTYQLLHVMGKTREITREQLTSGVVDYKRPLRTVEESEGFGSSGQVDTEMTVSEDSSIPKRKRGTLNSNVCEEFVIPVEVISLSKMSRYERQSLKTRLREELENIRCLKTRVTSSYSNVPVSSPYSDMHGFNDGKKRLPAERSDRASGIHDFQGNKRFKHGNIDSRTRPGYPERLGSVGQADALRASKAVLMKECHTLLDKMISHQYGWVFKKPVNVVELNIPDYFTIIKRPMDLGTIKNKILSGSYSSQWNFVEDVRLTFSNAMTYNPPGNDVHIMAAKLSKFFEMRWKHIEKKLFMVTDKMAIPSESVVNVEAASARPPAKRTTPMDHKNKIEPIQRAMTEEGKQIISRELEAILEELPVSIIDFLKQQSVSEGQGEEDEIEIEIDALSNDALFTLRKMLDEYLSEKQKIKEKVEHCEIELVNEPGLSNSSAVQCKDSGNDLVDDDVDVGGADNPIAGCLPKEMPKDTPALRDSKQNSSSSESASSSSDSDTGSSSDSEPDGTKNLMSPHTSKMMANVGERSDKGINGIVEKGQKSAASKSFTEEDGGRDGESAPSERQVSPEKLYRAALLRGRFADTILRAREKTFDKDDKLDPEKLRLKKEELERQQREERARLEAEAKAAEEARRKAEEEAAAEIRKKREAEREAARQALQKMEKTVDINECSQFIEDLEMFRGSRDPSRCINPVSPDESEKELGSFRFHGGSNPLQQLGLFMKDDEEDDDEVPQSSLLPTNEVEEGQID